MKKYNIIIVLVLISFLFFTSCDNLKLRKSATLYSNAEDRIKADFKAAYPTAGVSPDYNWSLPKEYYWVVTSQGQADEMIENTTSVVCDFDKEMLLVYTCTSTVGINRTYKLKSIKKSKDRLTVVLKTKQYAYYAKTSSAPWQRWFIIKMRKTEFEFFDLEL